MAVNCKKHSKQVAGKKAGSPTLLYGALVFVLALSVRGIYVYDSSDNPTFEAPVIDSLTYDQMARRAAETKTLDREFFWQQFFYPFYLTIVYILSNGSIVAAKVFQIILGSVTCVLTYRLGEKLFGRVAGFLAGCILAVYGPLIFFEGELLAAGWATFWAAVLLTVLLTAADTKSAGSCVVFGVCAGLAVLTRPNFIPFLLAACVWLGVLLFRAGGKKLARGFAGIVVGFCAVTMPVAAENHKVTGRFSFVPGTGGLNLYLGNNPDFEATSIRPGSAWKELVTMPQREGIGRQEQGRFFVGKTLEYVGGHPAEFLRGIARKGVEFFSSREMPGNIDIYLFRRWSPVQKVLTWKVRGFGFPFGAAAGAALVGLLLCRRKVHTALLLFAIFYPASVIVTHVEARYRMPFVVPAAVLAGAGLCEIGRMIRSKRWRAAGGTAAFCAAVGFCLSIAGPFYSERHVNYEAELYYGLGDSLDKHGQMEKAIEAYRKAVTLRPDYLEAHHNLALLLIKANRPGEALAHCKAVLEDNMTDAALYEDVGMALARQGRFADAIGYYEKAISIDSQRASIYDNLGTAYLQLNRPDEALRKYSQALELNADDPVTQNNMGNVLAMLGRTKEAIAHFEAALRLRPDDIDALVNLANALSIAGRFEEAFVRYEQALELSPMDAEIYCDLGYSLEQQGRTEEAIAAYKKALSINGRTRRARQGLARLGR